MIVIVKFKGTGYLLVIVKDLYFHLVQPNMYALNNKSVEILTQLVITIARD